MTSRLCGVHTPVTVTGTRDGNGSTVASSAVRMHSLVVEGDAASRSAAVPVTKGAAIEVPLMVT